MLEDVLWTTLYSDEQIRVIESIDDSDNNTQNSISELVELAVQLSIE
jgi:hypothetical protein